MAKNNIIVPKIFAKMLSWNELVAITVCASRYGVIETGFCYNINNHKAISSVITGKDNEISFKPIFAKLKRYPHQNIGVLHVHPRDASLLLSLSDFPVNVYQEDTIVNANSLEIITMNRKLFEKRIFRYCWTQYANLLMKHNSQVQIANHFSHIPNIFKIQRNTKLFHKMDRYHQQLVKEADSDSKKALHCLRCMIYNYAIKYGTIDRDLVQNVYTYFCAKEAKQ